MSTDSNNNEAFPPFDEQSDSSTRLLYPDATPWSQNLDIFLVAGQPSGAASGTFEDGDIDSPYYGPASFPYGFGHEDPRDSFPPSSASSTESEFPNGGPATEALTTPPQEPSIDRCHGYRRLSSTDQEVDAFLASCKVDGKRAYRCLWQGCQREPFKGKENARVHVHKLHLGHHKLFGCVTCSQQFGSEDAAKRHRDTTESRAFACESCGQTFARKDYRDLHYKKCKGKHLS